MNAAITRRKALHRIAVAGIALDSLHGLGAAEPAVTARRRPKLIAFDVIETLFDPSPIDAAMVELGLPKGSLKVWFARFLRDAFALEIIGQYKPFKEIATGTFEVMCRAQDLAVDEAKIAGVLARFATLPAHPDVKAGFEAVRAAGIRMITLTNGNAEVTRKMLEQAGLDGFIERGISIDEVGHWKPAKAVYLHAAKTMQVEPQEMALIAAHDWDTAGAGRAGLTTGGVERSSPFSAALPAPDVISRTLPETVRQLLALPA